MSQQTQVERVVGFYRAWLRRFPTLRSVALADKRDILRLWSGLGYNNRALRLQRLAQQVANGPTRALPRSPEELEKLPGIGKYTAHAIACFAFGAAVPLADVNIRRVLSRVSLRVKSRTEMRTEKEVWQIAESILPRSGAAEWNQALMELGARVCTARTPKCGECPIHTACRSAFSRTLLEEGPMKNGSEPTFKGVPRRIYRGKILKALHSRRLTSHQLARALIRDFRLRDLGWFHDILRRMHKDELIVLRKDGKGLQVQIAQ